MKSVNHTARKLLITVTISGVYGLASCERHDHDGSAHPHEQPGQDANHHQDEDGADVGKRTPGPNGGRVITSFEPPVELLVTDQRHVQIAVLDSRHQPVAPRDETVSVIAGDRANPTRLTFSRKGAVLLSDQALPEGDNFPFVLQLTTGADGGKQTEKFQMDLQSCPTCEYLEYACICGHDAEDHEKHED